jgi:hypothetical protein
MLEMPSRAAAETAEINFVVVIVSIP